MMKYFTKKWRVGCSDPEIDRVCRDYWSYIEENKASFPVNVRKLATDIDLHDGLLTLMIVNQIESSVVMGVVIGDLQTGYEDLVLAYSGVHLSEEELMHISALTACKKVGILYDELESLGDGIFEHRISFFPKYEIALQFKVVAIERTPCRSCEREAWNTIFRING